MKLGVLAKDVLTGFTGRVTAIAHYWTAGDKVMLEPEGLSDEGQVREELWFPVERIEILDSEPLQLPGQSADRILEGLDI